MTQRERAIEGFTKEYARALLEFDFNKANYLLREATAMAEMTDEEFEKTYLKDIPDV